MNKITLQIYFMMLLHFVGLLILNGQQSQSIMTGERIILFSDRTLYIAGEPILFSAFIQIGDESNNAESGSRVLYCELITPDGIKIEGKKYMIENSSASGYLKIPGEITSGMYYLRAYTKFMRNRGPSTYNYMLIKIVNPNKSEFQLGTDNNYTSENLSGEVNNSKNVDLFLISTDRSKYAPRDTVKIYVSSIGTNHSVWEGLNLSVVPEFSTSDIKVKLPVNGQFFERKFFYPETRGITVVGTLTDSIGGNPLPQTRVNLSIIGNGMDFMATRTDTAGRFFFSLPDYTGYRDLFISAENINNVIPKILVDNDFCTIPVHIPTIKFTLNQQERETAYNMAVNVQLDSCFKADFIPDKRNSQKKDIAFYGKPNEILYINDYVQLPTLEEYFNGLPTLVKIRKHQGAKYFKVLGTQTALTNFDPLILVDMVAIDDPSKVLSISPQNISRIEIVNVLYEKGDQIYGGIINIISKRGDFSGIDLPSSGVFINYDFLADTSHYPKIVSPMQHFPDTRNTLCWEPKLVLNKNNSAKVAFTTSDTPGKYLIILNGINSQGEAYRQTSTIEVMK